jgi:hypothetical protein
VNQELLLRNEYLAAENQILRAKLPGRVRLSNPERITLAEIGKRMGRKALRDVACVARPDTILGWYRRLVAQKFDGSKQRQYPGRPPVTSEVEALVVRMARENSGWGYDRIVGALANLGHQLSDQTVKNILRRHGIAPAPKRRQVTSWKDFLAAHMNVLAGCDFFTVEVLSWRGLVTYYVLFFIHLESRRVQISAASRSLARLQLRLPRYIESTAKQSSVPSDFPYQPYYRGEVELFWGCEAHLALVGCCRCSVIGLFPVGKQTEC